MEKEGIPNLGLIDNRDTNNPVNASCDCIIDKYGNTIYKSYSSIYKLTYKHIYKYKRISSIATDVILDVHHNSYIPLYYLYYFDINETDDNETASGKEKGTIEVQNERKNLELKNENEKREVTEESSTNKIVESLVEKRTDEFINEVTYNSKCPKKNFIKYDLNEMLLLRFLICNDEHDIEGELSKHCFLKERKPLVNKLANGVPMRYHREKSLNNSMNINLNDIAALNNGNGSILSSASLNNTALNFNSSERLRSVGTSAGDYTLSNRFLNNYQSPSLNTILALNALTQLNHLHQLNQVNSASPMSSQRPHNVLNPMGHVGSMQAANAMHSMGNIGNKVFKNIDDNYYNAPTNNIYIDKDGKMHLIAGDVGSANASPNKGGYNYNHTYNNIGGSNNRVIHNRFDRNTGVYYNNRDREIMGDFDYTVNFGNTEKRVNRKSGAEKYWDNPINYSKGTPIDIFTLGDIKKYAKNEEIRRNNNNNNNNHNNINFNDNNYSIFKDNEEDNLTKSNFAKWFKNANTSGNENENATSPNYVDNKNRLEDGTNTAINNNNTGNNITNNIYNNVNTSNKNRKGNENENEVENKQRSGNGEENVDENGDEKIKGAVADLLVKQISVLKERSSDKNLEHKSGSFDYFNNTGLSNDNVDTNWGLSGDNELYGKEAGKRLLEMFKNYNTTNETHGNFQYSKVRNNIGQANIPLPQYQQHPGGISPHHLQQLQQMQHLQQLQHSPRHFRTNMKMNNFHGKVLSADHFSYKKGYGVDNYINGNIGNVNYNHGEHQMGNKRMGRSRESLNNFMFSEKNRNLTHGFPPYQYRNNIQNSDVFVKGGPLGGGINGKPYSCNNVFDLSRNRHKNKSQGNINITPIINSLLHIDNDYEHSDEDLININQDAYIGNNIHNGNIGGGGGGGGGYTGYNTGNYMYGNNHNSHSISENIQNAKVNNVLESLKSLLKASKGHTGLNEHGVNNNINIGTDDGMIHNDTYNNVGTTKSFNNTNVNGDGHNEEIGDTFGEVDPTQTFQVQHGQQQQQQRTSYKDINKNMFFKKEKFNTKYQEQESTGGNEEGGGGGGGGTQKKW